MLSGALQHAVSSQSTLFGRFSVYFIIAISGSPRRKPVHPTLSQLNSHWRSLSIQLSAPAPLAPTAFRRKKSVLPADSRRRFVSPSSLRSKAQIRSIRAGQGVGDCAALDSIAWLILVFPVESSGAALTRPRPAALARGELLFHLSAQVVLSASHRHRSAPPPGKFFDHRQRP